MSKGRRTNGSANPFVVLADLSLAMCFLFAVISVEFSREQSERNRNIKQSDIRRGFVELLISAGVGTTPKCYVSDPGSSTRLIESPCDSPDVGKQVLMRYGADRELAVEIWRNGSYQRLMLYTLFRKGSSEILADMRGPLLDLARDIRDKFVMEQIAYVNLHGTAEKDEGPNREQRGRLCVRRAEAMRRVFIEAGALPSDTEMDDYENSVARARTSGESVESQLAYWRKRNYIDPRFFITYGKDGLYRSGKIAGRVDIVLFYTDKIKDVAE